MQVLARGQRDRPRGTRARSRRSGSRADHVREQQRRVGHVARQRARLVERGGEGDHAVARDGAVGRLEPDDAAQRRGLADRAAGVGAERPRREARGDRGGAAARGAARHALAIPGVERRAERRVLGRGAHRELVLVGLPEQRRAGVREARDHGRRVGRAVALEDARARLARDALGAEEVLDGERHAAERRVAAPGAGGRSATHVKQLSAPPRSCRARPRGAR